MNKGAYKTCRECPHDDYCGCKLGRDSVNCPYVRGLDSCSECFHDDYCGCCLGYESEYCPYLNHDR